MTAWERADVPALLDLLVEDARFTMPPLPAWFDGREDVGRFLAERVFATPWRLRRSRPVGATTYLGLKGYWPAVAADPTKSPAVANHPELADLHRETGERNNQIRKLVVSDSPTPDDTAPWTETSTKPNPGPVHDGPGPSSGPANC